MLLLLLHAVVVIRERFRTMFTANSRNDQVTMFILYLLLAVFGFSVTLISFAVASKVRIILHCSLFFFKKT